MKGLGLTFHGNGLKSTADCQRKEGHLPVVGSCSKIASDPESVEDGCSCRIHAQYDLFKTRNEIGPPRASVGDPADQPGSGQSFFGYCPMPGPDTIIGETTSIVGALDSGIISCCPSHSKPH